MSVFSHSVLGKRLFAEVTQAVVGKHGLTSKMLFHHAGERRLSGFKLTESLLLRLPLQGVPHE